MNSLVFEPSWCSNKDIPKQTVSTAYPAIKRGAAGGALIGGLVGALIRELFV